LKSGTIKFINSCTGYKSANLIATKSEDGAVNVAIFAGITHLGSNPVKTLLFVPTVPRNTYKNIKATRYFTVNHITEEMILHHTSANYESGVSELLKPI
jgi:flavin reductase (DIM6/NTAB) family NADH-FMN oxidoreductase RutF